jgi:hypothetical protein
VGSASRRTGVPHFDSKYQVEEHIARIGVRATIAGPVYFMENLFFGKEQLAKGIYASALPPARKLAQVAVADIGAVAARLVEDPRSVPLPPLQRDAGTQDCSSTAALGEPGVALSSFPACRRPTPPRAPLPFAEGALRKASRASRESDQRQEMGDEICSLRAPASCL